MKQPFGFHKNQGGEAHEVGPIGDHIAQLSDAGLRPIFCCVDEAGLAVEVAAAGGLAVYSKDVWRAPPDYNQSPGDAAAERWAGIRDLIPPEIAASRDGLWIEILNEPDKERAPFVFAFMTALAALANDDGYRVCGPSWSTGTPEVDAWETPEGLAWLRYCAANHDMAAVALHEYSLDADDIETGSPWLVGRFQFVRDVCDAHGIDYPQFVITECGWAYDDMPGSAAAMAQIPWLGELYGDIPICLWTLGKWKSGENLAPKLAAIVDDLTRYILDVYEPVDPEPEPDPVPVDEFVWQRALELAPTNTDAALQKALTADARFRPYGVERWQEHPGGDVYAIQPAIDWATGERAVAYALVPDWGNVQILTDPYAGPEIVDITDDLVTHDTRTYQTRDVADINWLTIHHTATPNTTTPEQIASYHVNSRGWPGIAYHYLIHYTGTIWQTNDMSTISYHDALNTDSVGVGLIGDFTDAPPPADQLQAAAALIEWLRGQIDGVQVRPHRAVGQTACPGNTWTQWWPDITGEEPAPLPNHLEIEPLSQRDPRWADVTLGQDTDHGETIGSFGCLFVDYVVMAQFLGLDDRTLLQVHEHFKQAGSFSAQYLRNGAFRIAYPDALDYNGYRVRTDSQMEPVIRAYLDDGLPVAARVDFVPETSGREQHWVVLIGYDGDDYVIADPWTGTIGMLSEVYGIAGVDVLEAVYYRPKASEPAPTLDLLPYLMGQNGHSHEMAYNLGGKTGTHPLQMHHDGQSFYIVKGWNGEYESLYYDDGYIYRDIDTSEAPNRFYVQRTIEGGKEYDGHPWAARHMAVGDTFHRQPHVVHFWQDTCQVRLQGDPASTLTLLTHHDSLTFSKTGISVKDVIVLSWSGGERYYFARGESLVGFEVGDGWSYISERHNRQLTRNAPGCYRGFPRYWR